LAFEKLTNIGGNTPSGMVSRMDATIYTTALVLGAVCAGITMSGTDLNTPILVLCLAFVFMGGLATSRLIHAAKMLAPIHLGKEVDEGINGTGGEIEMRKGNNKHDETVTRHTAMTTKILALGIVFSVSFLVLGGIVGLGLNAKIGLQPSDEGFKPMIFQNTTYSNYLTDATLDCLVMEGSSIMVTQESRVVVFEGFLDTVAITLPYGRDEVFVELDNHIIDVLQTDDATGIVVSLPRRLYAGSSGNITLVYTIADPPGSREVFRDDRTAVIKTPIFTVPAPVWEVQKQNTARNLVVKISLPTGFEVDGWEPVLGHHAHQESRKAKNRAANQEAVEWVISGNYDQLGPEPWKFGIRSKQNLE
jgi:hypothetical protein